MQAAPPSALAYNFELTYVGFPLFLHFPLLKRTQHSPTLDIATYIGSYTYQYLPTLG